MRNSRAPQLGMVYFTRNHWFEMQSYILANHLGVEGMVYPEYVRDMMRKLAFTHAEWEVFEKAVVNGEFLQL